MREEPATLRKKRMETARRTRATNGRAARLLDARGLHEEAGRVRALQADEDAVHREIDRERALTQWRWLCVSARLAYLAVRAHFLRAAIERATGAEKNPSAAGESAGKTS